MQRPFLSVSLVSPRYLPQPACVRAVRLPKGATLLCFVLGMSLFQNSTLQRPLRCGPAQILWVRVSLHCGQCWLVAPLSSGLMFVVNCSIQPVLPRFVPLSQRLCTIRWRPHVLCWCPLSLTLNSSKELKLSSCGPAAEGSSRKHRFRVYGKSQHTAGSATL